MEFEMTEGRDIHQPVAGDYGFAQRLRGRAPERGRVSKANVDPDDNAEETDRAMYIPDQEDG